MNNHLIALPITLLLIVLAGCAREAPVQGNDVNLVDTSFQESVLADQEVTKTEAGEGVRRLLNCLTDAGLTGEVWIDPLLDPANYAVDLSFPREQGQPDIDPVHEGEQIESAVNRCEAGYHLMLSTYRQQHNGAEHEEQRRAALECLSAKVPELYEAAVTIEWPGAKDDLVEQANRRHDEETASAAYKCVTYYGTPWRPLSEGPM